MVKATGTDGKPTADVTVTIDGQKLTEHVDGTIELDPGTHKATFAVAGQPAHEEDLVLKAGEKDRLVEMSFAPPPAPEPVVPPPATPASAAPDEHRSNGKRTAGFVVGGVGLAALAGGVFFWADSQGKVGGLDACKPSCTESQVDAVKHERLFGDIAFGGGLALAGVATYLILTSSPKAPPPKSASVSVDVGPDPSGFTASSEDSLAS